MNIYTKFNLYLKENSNHIGEKLSDSKFIEQLKSELDKYESSEQLLRGGGLSNELLDRLAFGFSENDIKTIHPSKLRVRWKNDLYQVNYEIENSPLTPIEWAKTIDLSEPIDIDYWESEELEFKRGFYIQDGHHRYMAAKLLNKLLNANLQIKLNPIKEISPSMGYDEFHRYIFEHFK